MPRDDPGRAKDPNLLRNKQTHTTFIMYQLRGEEATLAM
jgi:hypothetical protein